MENLNGNSSELSGAILGYREAARIKQTKLAEMLEVSSKAVGQWEIGKYAPSEENLFKLFQVFINLKVFPGDPAQAEKEAERLWELAYDINKSKGYSLTFNRTRFSALLNGAPSASARETPTTSTLPEPLPAPKRPTGTVTFLFTDIEGSTKLWENHKQAMELALEKHDRLFSEIVAKAGGYLFKMVGDAVYAAFQNAQDALQVALSAQRALFAESWPAEIGLVKVRMALHTGEAQERDGDYFGPTLNRVARLLSTGYGGQILLSRATYEVVRDRLPEGVGLRDLGEHRLKDLINPEQVFQVVAPGLPEQFSELKSLNSSRTNLPLQPNPLLGREKEVKELLELLRQPTTRLVTLTGPGGTGKTRLSLEVAAELVDDFPDGVFFIELDEVRDPMLVFSTIARILGVKESGAQGLIESIRNYTQNKKLLIVLDNFEQVVGAARLVGESLKASPGLKILASSREVLRISWEKEYPVPPLALPPVRPFGNTGPIGSGALRQLLNAEEMARYPSVELFVQMASRVKPDFRLTDQNALAVAQICLRLDGLPLAIELAANRLKMFGTPQALYQRLQRIFSGGSQRDRDRPERHQTMQSVMDWSYELMSESEKQLFTRLAVFVGGWTLEAAEAVCQADQKLEIELWDALEGLLNKSLVRCIEPDEASPLEVPYYYMLNTIRDYAAQKLNEECGECNDLRAAHAIWYLQLASEATLQLQGPGQKLALARLEQEHDNFRAALDWMLNRAGAADAKYPGNWEEPLSPAEMGLRLAVALWRFWDGRGYWSEGRNWLELALSRNAQTTPDWRAAALHGMGALARLQSDYALAQDYFEQALELRRQLGDKAGTAATLGSLGTVMGSQGHLDQAIKLLEESLALKRQGQDKWQIAVSLNNLAGMLARRGDFGRVVELLEEALKLYRQLGDKQETIRVLNNLGWIAFLQGNYDRADEFLGQSEALCRTVDNPQMLAPVLNNLGWVSLFRADYEQATARLSESLYLFSELGDRRSISECLEALAGVAAGQGDWERAAQLLGAEEAVQLSFKSKVEPTRPDNYEQVMAKIQAGLGATALAEAMITGRQRSMEEILAFALNQTPIHI